MSGTADEKPQNVDVSYIFRSRAQMMILAKVLFGDTPSTLSELARFSGSSRSTIAKEVQTLVRHEIVTTVQQGRNILVKPRSRVRDLDAIVTLLMRAAGPIKEIPKEFFTVKGVSQLFIYGPWAERFHTKSGPLPHVIDVLAVGKVSVTAAIEACERVEKKLAFGNTYNAQVVSEEVWNNSNDYYVRRVREGSLVELSVVPDDMTPGSPNSPEQRYPPDPPPWDGIVG